MAIFAAIFDLDGVLTSTSARAVSLRFTAFAVQTLIGVYWVIRLLGA